jgi:hypothetical protein
MVILDYLSLLTAVVFRDHSEIAKKQPLDECEPAFLPPLITSCIAEK